MTYCSNCGTKLAAKTSFCRECGTPVVRQGNNLPATGARHPQPPGQKAGQPTARRSNSKLILLISLLVLAALLLAGGAFILLKGWPGAGKNTEKWEAATIETSDMTSAVSEIFPAGIILELRANGSFKLTVEGEQAGGRWQLKGEDLILTGKAIKASGQIVAEKMILDDLFGYRFVFYKQGSAQTRSDLTSTGCLKAGN